MMPTSEPDPSTMGAGSSRRAVSIFFSSRSRLFTQSSGRSEYCAFSLWPVPRGEVGARGVARPGERRVRDPIAAHVAVALEPAQPLQVLLGEHLPPGDRLL